MKKIIFTLLFISFFLATIVNAQLVNSQKGTEIKQNANDLASSTGYSTTNTLEDLIATIIRILTGILGTIFLALTFVAGNNWMQAGGNEEKAKKALETIRDLIIGLALCLIIYALASGLGGMISGLLLAF